MKKFISTWWYKKTFSMPQGDDNKLVFDGVGVKCCIWINGILLGTHEGMFGGTMGGRRMEFQDK